MTWDDDQPLEEDAAIQAAHPTRSGRHDEYQEAMRMVGAKRTKGALVGLVTWLLIRVNDAEAQLKDGGLTPLDVKLGLTPPDEKGR